MSTEINKSQILNELKAYYGFNSDSDFADFLGIKRQTLSSWHTRNTFDIELLYAKCVNVDGNFLLTGKGNIKKPNVKDMSQFENVTNTVTFLDKTKSKENVSLLKEQQPDYTISKELPHVVDIIPSGNANVIILPVKSAASDFTRALTDPVFIKGNYETMSLPKLQYRKGPFFAVEIEGDSMHPTLTHGEYLVGSPIIAHEFTGGYLHTFFHSEEGLITKRVHWASKKEGILLLNSDNENIDDIEVNIKDVSPYFLKGICSVNFNLRNWNNDVRKDIRDIKKQISVINSRLK